MIDTLILNLLIEYHGVFISKESIATFAAALRTAMQDVYDEGWNTCHLEFTANLMEGYHVTEVPLPGEDGYVDPAGDTQAVAS